MRTFTLILDKSLTYQTVHNCIVEWEAKSYSTSDKCEPVGILVHRMVYYQLMQESKKYVELSGIQLDHRGNMTIFGIKVITTCDIPENAVMVI